MTVPAWLIPAVRAALRLAVRLLRRYDEAHSAPCACRRKRSDLDIP
jgi:hypothetical protein